MLTVLTTAWRDAAALPRDRKTLRNFGVVVGGVLAGVALYLVWMAGWEPSAVSTTLGAIGGLLLLLGMLAPRLLGPAYPVWMALALVLGTVMTAVLLTLVFYLVVTPIGLLMRAVGKDPMHRTPDASQETYWIERTPESHAVKRMEKFY